MRMVLCSFHRPLLRHQEDWCGHHNPPLVHRRHANHIAWREHDQGEAVKIFEMKDLEAARKIFAISIVQDCVVGALELSRCNYVKKALAKFSMEDLKPTKVLLANHFKLLIAHSPKLKKGLHKWPRFYMHSSLVVRHMSWCVWAQISPMLFKFYLGTWATLGRSNGKP